MGRKGVFFLRRSPVYLIVHGDSYSWNFPACTGVMASHGFKFSCTISVRTPYPHISMYITGLHSAHGRNLEIALLGLGRMSSTSSGKTMTMMHFVTKLVKGPKSEHHH